MFKLFLVAGMTQALFIGDMAVDMSQQKKGGALLHVELWEDGVLPIQFESYLPKEKREMFMDACAEWSKVSNVKCIEGYYKDRIVQVTSSIPGCWAVWGMGTHFAVLQRQINLSEVEGCWNDKTITHELGHAFGLIHEHQRPDRDTYIEMKYENLNAGFFDLAKIINYNKQDILLSTPYDFNSIMHYSAYQDSKNGKPVMVPQKDYTFEGMYMGGWKISSRDGQVMSMLYGSPK